MKLERVFIISFHDEMCALLYALHDEIDTSDLSEDGETMEELHDCFEDYLRSIFDNRSAQMRRDILGVLCSNAMVDQRETAKLDDLLTTLILNKMHSNIVGFTDVTSATLVGMDQLTGSYIFKMES
jgi:hypothetical protein